MRASSAAPAMPAAPASEYPPRSATRATQFRSTWIVASLDGLRARGHFERYVVRVAPAHRDALLGAVAGVWLPMSAARAHYTACDALGLSPEEQLAMGSLVADGARRSVLATVVKVARAVDVTPWSVLPQIDRFWRRAVDGGSVVVERVGPKEARADFAGCELFDIAYFRAALRGVIVALAPLFCRRAYAHDMGGQSSHELRLRLQWV